MFPVAQEGDFPDLPTKSWFDYAANESIARAFDLFRSARRERELIHDRDVVRTLSPFMDRAGLFTPRLDVTDRVQ